jgi:hypothetical protein
VRLPLRAAWVPWTRSTDGPHHSFFGPPEGRLPLRRAAWVLWTRSTPQKHVGGNAVWAAEGGGGGRMRLAARTVRSARAPRAPRCPSGRASSCSSRVPTHPSSFAVSIRTRVRDSALMLRSALAPAEPPAVQTHCEGRREASRGGRRFCGRGAPRGARRARAQAQRCLPRRACGLRGEDSLISIREYALTGQSESTSSPRNGLNRAF